MPDTTAAEVNTVNVQLVLRMAAEKVARGWWYLRFGMQFVGSHDDAVDVVTALHEAGRELGDLDAARGAMARLARLLRLENDRVAVARWNDAAGEVPRAHRDEIVAVLRQCADRIRR